MSDSLAQQIWEELSARLGSDLRAVARYHHDSRDVILRDDLEKEYSNTEIQDLLNELIIDQLRVRDTSQKPHLDCYRGRISVFDAAWIIQYPDSLDTKSGTVVSIQRSDACGSFEDVEVCLSYLEDAV